MLAEDHMPDGLIFEGDEPTHGFIAPAAKMPSGEYIALVRLLRDRWRRA